MSYQLEEFFNDSIMITNEYVYALRLKKDSNNEPLVLKDHEMLLDEYIKKLNNRCDLIYNDVLPEGCKYYRVIGDNVIMVVEDEPQIRTITTSSDSFSLNPNNPSVLFHELQDSGKLELFNIDYKRYFKPPFNFTLAFPYIIYVIDFSRTTKLVNELKIFFKNTKTETLDDELFNPNLSNIYYPKNTVCIDTNFRVNLKHYIKEKEDNSEIIYLTEYIDLVKNNFWISNFNSDLFSHIQDYSKLTDCEINNYYEWQYNTEKNPEFILSCSLIPSRIDKSSNENLTIRKIINSVEQNTSNSCSIKAFDLFSEDRIIENKEINFNNNIKNEVISRKVSSLNIGGYPFLEGDIIYYHDNSYYINKCIIATKITLNYDTYEKNISIVGRFIEGENIETNELETILLTDKVENDIIEQFNKMKETNEIIYNDKKIKINDIVKLNNKIFYKVNNIKKNRFGHYEIKLNKNVYLFDFIKDKIEIADLNNIYYNNVKIENNHIYGISKLRRGFSKFYGFYELCGMDTSFDGNLALTFNKVNNDNMLISNDDYDEELIIDLESNIYNIELEETFNEQRCLTHLCSLNKIYFINNTDSAFILNNNSNNSNNIYLHPEDISNFRNNSFTTNKTITNISNLILLENNTRLFINNINVNNNIDLKVGDSVMTTYNFAEDPSIINNQYIIEGFEVSAEYSCIYVNLRNILDDSIIKISFVIMDSDGVCNVSSGIIRKTINSYEGFERGKVYKLNGNEKIYNFFKKDNLRLINIIDDVPSGEKLFLFSNYCTLFFDTVVNNFVETNKPETDININKIPLQPNDLVIVDNQLVFVSKYINKIDFEGYKINLLRYYDKKDNKIVYSGSWDSKYYNINYKNIYGIPNPRVKVKTEIYPKIFNSDIYYNYKS